MKFFQMFCFCLLILACSTSGNIKETVKSDLMVKPANFVFFGLDRDEVRNSSFYNFKQFYGAQIAYTWKSLEPEKDVYDFSEIEDDLLFLTRKGKKLFVQIMDTSFSMKWKFIPNYLCDVDEYNGGVNIQYRFSDEMDNNPEEVGWVSRRWDNAVANRFHKLLLELGKQFDGRIEGLNFQEVGVDFGDTGKYFPPGFTPEIYVGAIKANMNVARQAFSKSIVLQYANFMPGEWLPNDNKGYLASIFEYAASIGIGIGGPDTIPYRLGQMNHAYFFVRQYQEKVKIGFAVQEGNYDQINIKTGEQLTVEEIYNFSKNYLQSDFIFWYPQEPYFTKNLKPLLKRSKIEL